MYFKISLNVVLEREAIDIHLIIRNISHSVISYYEPLLFSEYECLIEILHEWYFYLLEDWRVFISGELFVYDKVIVFVSKGRNFEKFVIHWNVLINLFLIKKEIKYFNHLLFTVSFMLCKIQFYFYIIFLINIVYKIKKVIPSSSYLPFICL